MAVQPPPMMLVQLSSVMCGLIGTFLFREGRNNIHDKKTLSILTLLIKLAIC